MAESKAYGAAEEVHEDFCESGNNDDRDCRDLLPEQNAGHESFIAQLAKQNHRICGYHPSVILFR